MKNTSFLCVLLAVFFMAMGASNDLHQVGSLNSAHAHSGATGIVKDRMDRFKDSQTALKAIAAAIKAQEFNAIDAPAQLIAQWGDEMVAYFPEGSNPSPSEALDVIWQEMDQFKTMAESNANAAKRLKQLALSGDQSKIKPAFNELVGSCKSCHQKFRQ